MNTLGTPSKSYTDAGGSTSYVTDAGTGSTLSLYEHAGVTEFHALCTWLEAQGWTLYSSMHKNGSRFATYAKGEALYHLYLTADQAGLRVVRSDKANLPPQGAIQAGEGEITLTQLRLYKTESNVYTNGMGYVIRLSDGSFIIVDGGHNDQVVDQLWNTLVDQNGGKTGIVVRAWLLTHSHGDHYGALSSFADKYGEFVTVEYFMAARVNAALAEDTFFSSKLPQIVEKYVARGQGTKLCTPHTGMTFGFGELTLEILFAPDENYVNVGGKLWDFNSSGVVYRLTGAGDRMLFLGDVMHDVTDRLTGIWGAYLESDMVQVAHHGVGDSTAAFYESLKPQKLFYPAGELLYKGENGDFGESKPFANNWNRNGAVRKALEVTGKYEILLQDETAYRYRWGSKKPAERYTAPTA